MKREVLVVGGGPAGAATSALLACRGIPVTVIEARDFPRSKLCGDFISPEARAILAELGLLDAIDREASKITEASFFSPQGRQVRIPFPERSHGFGLSRSRLDSLLLNKAAACGAEVLTGIQATGVLWDRGRICGVRVQSSRSRQDHTFEARYLIAADGHHSRFRRWTRPDQFPGKEGDLALQAHFHGVEGSHGSVDLFFYPGGYAGLVHIEDDLWNLCLLVQARDYLPRGANPDTIFAATVLKNPVARERLLGARRVSRWQGMSHLNWGVYSPSRSGLLFVGDAAGTIPPFLGEGVTMALRGGQIAASVLENTLGVGSKIGGTSPESIYGRIWSRELRRPYRLATLLSFGTRSPLLRKFLLSGLARSPSLASLLLAATRSTAFRARARPGRGLPQIP
ncbi:MAG: NAD(P)/FAD-dependent oxidoreductase [Candidatus Tectomicrobia bacterium]|uniref:NAD(P)/FAD-dependent oxidoreductase n=1 Tax=Tectimicrobiota bacterium TaxID=2528274 RepID=A0A932GPQ3_UNCTE|nr:NAD(P)/FAD-dependent oxidoreductase [Candidatus Tectomicrobia bacterium]